MLKAKKDYLTPDGRRFPLFEAPYNYTITVYKSDCKKAVIADPSQCLIAMGAKRDKAVEAVYIGSGKDAYVVFKATKLREAHALHFTVNAKAARVRDYFDTHKGVATQVITLSAPTGGRTLAHRQKLGKVRRQAIKNGAPVKKREAGNKTRITRLGVPHRPRAVIESNVVTMPQREAVA